ncbi:MAG: NUDIX hydrolase [Deltaproteobacteria bacterium]|nr:NUDIX hydrolase [Deltaproteobacteria bacterium]
MSNSPDPRPWKLLRQEPGPDLRVFKSRFDWRLNPRNNCELKCLILESRDWVNVVALTPEKEVVLVKQFRFGRGEVTIEIPGGVVDGGEEHGAAARRELTEETGFSGGKWTYLGASEPNPAILDNLCHHWLVEDVVQDHSTQLDEGEDIKVFTTGKDNLAKMIKSGELRHSLVLVALHRALKL